VIKYQLWEEEVMPTFVSLVTLTDQGVKNIKESPQRFEAFKAMAEQAGIKIESVYYTQGQYDMVTIMEGSDETTMVSFLKLVSLGNARTQTMRAFSVEEMKGFISKMA
jgi:uncharacterized protein with GYD domain